MPSSQSASRLSVPAYRPEYGDVPGWAVPTNDPGVTMSQSTRQYRTRTDNRPESWWDDPEQEGLWDADRSLVEEEFEAHIGLGSKNPRIEEREVCADGEHDPGPLRESAYGVASEWAECKRCGAVLYD